MSYKTILVHADRSLHAAGLIKLACGLAIGHQAHLIGAAMSGLSSFVYQSSAMGYSVPLMPVDLEFLDQYAREALDQFDALCNALGVDSFERRLIDDAPESGLVLQARYADLVVLGQSDPDERSPRSAADLPQYVMLNCARPLLIVPYAGSFEQVGARPLLAWDGSREATRAISYALPLLTRAEEVTVAVFNAAGHPGVHGDQPGADLALYLARHGVKVTVTDQRSTISVGEALLSQAGDMGADLLVMGGYGHSRFREVLLGGVTSTMLKSMTVPLLMAH